MPKKVQRTAQMTPQELKELISTLDASAPVTASLERELTKIGMWDSSTQWYSTQQKHWIGWLSGYDGPGAYGRDASKKRTAQFSFNHIMCPPMVLWLCEASGVETSRVAEAMKNALASRRVFASQCAAIRKVIPWTTVALALRTSQK